MIIKEALAQAIEKLEATCLNPDVDAIYLLTYLLNTNTAWIFLHSDELLSESNAQKFLKLIDARAQGKPVAYLTQTRGFWALDFYVNEHVLIPRPETELLVELTLEHLNQSAHKIADLGTGSGAISISLAHERPNWHIDAVDLSSKALEVAQLNAKNLNTPNVHFYQGSWFQALPEKDYDAIISNPPYLANDDPHLNQGDLRFEPHSALASGESGLECYELIIKDAKSYLKKHGLLILEHGFKQREALINLLEANNYQNIQAYDDYQNLPRVIIAHLA